MLGTAEWQIKKEICWVISNATSGGTVPQIQYLVGCGCIKRLCEMLSITDKQILDICLEALENILKVCGFLFFFLF
jgi:hypothetical protein